jgi:pimeloyl-ACP methyl ester carboxylesterase
VIEPFTIAVGEDVLADLRARIGATRWPDEAPGGGWEQGTELTYVRELLGYWADGFDWREQERRLNGFAHFRADIDGVGIHFVHERAPGGDGIPLIVSHGWPSSFAESLELVPLLRDRFDLVMPSLPGYGFSERPYRTLTTRDTARLWHRLMRELGYERYGAQGGDFGASVSTWMALDEPEPMLGLHLHNLDDTPYTGPGAPPLSDAERAYVAQVASWDEAERGYSTIQGTKPQTLAYALTDSPAGLAAWILEKWRSWTDPRSQIDRDFLLTTLTLYWATGTIGSSIRDYYDMRHHATQIGPEHRVEVPTAVAVFANMLADEGTPPREWAQRLYNVRRWTVMPRGGHFAPAEEPELLAADIRAFFGEGELRG